MFVIGWGKRVCLKDILDNVKKDIINMIKIYIDLFMNKKE